jgi:hypothetical protein
MPKRREKVMHLGGRPAKHYDQLAMFCARPAWTNSKAVVLVGKSW